MKKVAIMTWHQYENYGGCLQCLHYIINTGTGI